MDKASTRDLWGGRFRSLAVVFGTFALVIGGALHPLPASAEEGRSAARVDVSVGNGGIIDPAQANDVSVIIRADETGALGVGDITLRLTEDPFTSEDQIRRFISGDSDPVFTDVASTPSPEVPQLESREVPLVLPARVWGERLVNDRGSVESTLQNAVIFGLETVYQNPGNLTSGLRQLEGRQLIIVVPEGVGIGRAAIAPIVTLTTSATGGQALRPEELQALTISGGALDVVTSTVRNHPATIAIDSRITSSISVLGDLAPPEALIWASTLGAVGLAQFALPWADANPLTSLEIDTMVYARLGEYPWVHDTAMTKDQLATLATRSASAVLVSSDSLQSDRAVVSLRDARIIRVDEQLSELAKDALQAPTPLEAEADLQRAQGIIAYRAITNNPEILVFSTGRLPATAIAPGIDRVLARFATMPVATAVAVPLNAPANESVNELLTRPVSGEAREFVRAIKTLWEGDVQFATIANDPEDAVYGRWTRYQSLLSSTWLDDSNGLQAEWDRAQQESVEFRNSVRVEQGSAITVLSDQTSLPITVVNDLDSDVVVNLVVRPTTGSLAVEEPTTTLVIPAASSLRTLVPVQSLANGTVPVEFLLTTTGGEQIGQSVTVLVTIRAGWEGVISVGLAVLVGGTFAFGIVRAIQRRRSLHHQQEDSA